MEKIVFRGYMLRPFSGYMAYESDVRINAGGKVDGIELYFHLKDAEDARDSLPMRVARNMEIAPVHLIANPEAKKDTNN